MESEQINLNNACRTCKNESPEMKSLYQRDSESDQEHPRLDEMLMACTTVQVNKEDNLPKIICRTCFVQLKNAYCFKEQCEKTDMFLRDYLKNLNGADIKQEVPSDEEEYEPNVIADNESTPNNTNNDKDITESIRDDNESQSGHKDVDYVQIFRDLIIYKCRTCFKKFYTVEGLRNHKKSQHNVQLNIDGKMGEFPIQSDEKVNEVRGVGLDMGTDIMEPEIEVSENNDQDKIDEIAQISNEIYLEENEDIEEVTNVDEDNGSEYKSEGSADSEYLPSGTPSQKIKRGRGRSRKYPVGYKLSSEKPRQRPLKRFECETCNKKFSRMDTLKRHKRSHVVVPYTCDICEMVFYEEDSLVRHKAYKHNIGEKAREKKFQCQYCLKAFTSVRYRDNHMQVHLEDKFHCKICGKKFTSKSYFTKHMKFHDGSAKKFLCTECGQRFTRNDYLLLHIGRHRGDKPFKCKFCDKGFLRTIDLAVHERYHTGEKTHLCVTCGKGFGRAYNLTVHMRTHTGEKPYRCTYCDAAFAQGNDLKAHVRRHTGERFPCELCPETFRLGYLLTQHKRAVHGLNIVSNVRRLQQVKKLNPDDPPPILVPLPTPVVVASAIPTDPLQIEESDMPEVKQE